MTQPGLKPSFFTFVVSACATRSCTRVHEQVAQALTILAASKFAAEFNNGHENDDEYVTSAKDQLKDFVNGHGDSKPE
jgi:hypothetical protein